MNWSIKIIKKIWQWIYHVFSFFNRLLALLMQWLIYIYQIIFSPSVWLLGHILWRNVCCHTPHCSQFGLEVFKRYWFIRWFHYTMERVSSCTWWTKKVYDPAHIRLVYFSWSPIWVPFLHALVADDRFELIWVVTQPAVPYGRWMNYRDNIIAQEVSAYNKKTNRSIPVYTPSSLKTTHKKYWDDAQSCISCLQALQPDIILVVAYWKILPRQVLDIPIFGTINVHWSLLPKFRWASPLQSVFLDDHDAAWFTVMKMSEWLDEWAILSSHPLPIQFDRTVLTLIEQLSSKAPKQTLETIWSYCKWRVDPIPQDDTEATFCWKIAKEEAEIDWFTDSLSEIYKKYQAYALWPKIYTHLYNKIVIIESMILHQAVYSATHHLPLFFQEKWWSIVLHQAVKSLYVKPAWKKSMHWDEFIRWYADKSKK